jgi:type I restriction enzyme S subunit
MNAVLSQSPPPNWTTMRLGEIMTPVRVRVRDLPDSDVAVLSTARNVGLILQSEKFDKRVASHDISNYLVVRREQIVCGFPMDEGVIFALTNHDIGAVSPAYQVWAVSSSAVDVGFLDTLLKTPDMLRRYRMLERNVVERRRTVSRQDFVNIEVGIPPLPEQKAIARALRSVQQARETRRRELELERERKAALMEHLFTHGTRNEPTKQTEVGEMPESWDVVPLGEIALIERGKFSHRPRNDPAYYGGDTPFIQTGDVTACGGYIRTYSQTLNDLGLSVSRVFPTGTIVITIAANIGFTGILTFDSAFPDSLIGITPKADVDRRFLHYFLSTQQAEMDRLAPRGTQKNINIQFLTPWLTPLPSADEQIEIADALAAADRQADAIEREVTLLDELFEAMLEELMTGRLSAVPLVDQSQ